MSHSSRDAVKTGTSLDRPPMASPTSPPRRILFLESGGGFGGSSVFLRDLLKHLDRREFEPYAGFYFRYDGPRIEELRTMGVPLLFVSKRRPPRESYFFLPSLLKTSRWKSVNALKSLVRLLLRLIVIELPLTWGLLRLLGEKQFSLVVLNNDVHYHVAGTIAANLKGIPCLCRKAGGIGEGKRLKKFLTPLVDLFISVSAATENDQRTNNPSTKRLITIHEGVDLARFDSSLDPSVARTDLGLTHGVKVVGFVSRLVAGKGHKELLQAAAIVVKSYPNVVFIIVGGEPSSSAQRLKAELQLLVESLHLRNHVIFSGWREDVPRLLAAFDVFVHCPTTWIEGLGIANLEAMAMGKPTIVTDNGGLPDVTVDHLTGFVVPRGDVARLAEALVRLLGDQPLARQMGRNARQRIETEFDISKNVKKMERLFEEYALRPLETKRGAGDESASVSTYL